MGGENKEHIVDYAYCLQCKHVKVVDTEDPCNECLTTPVNINSRKPINFAPARAVKNFAKKV